MTSRQVMLDGDTITHAYHDESDHGWQFFSEEGATTKDAMVVCLREIVETDQSILAIADLQPGWMAVRESREAPWIRREQFADAVRITVDWRQVRTESDFYDTVLPQCGSPAWHGRNLDALQDSWVTGGIDRCGPPYQFEFINSEDVAQGLIGFRDAVLEIALASIDENGGRRI